MSLSLPVTRSLAPAALAILGAALFITGDLLGPGALRLLGGSLALGAYAVLVINRRPARSGREADTERREPGARHVA